MRPFEKEGLPFARKYSGDPPEPGVPVLNDEDLVDIWNGHKQASTSTKEMHEHASENSVSDIALTRQPHWRLYSRTAIGGAEEVISVDAS